MTRILVVDDSAVDRRLVGAVLEKVTEWEILYSDNGKHALELIDREPVDVVVTDLQMPEMNGLELVKRVAQREHPIPVILITSCGSEIVAMEALRAGAASYSPKSAIRADLVPTVKGVLQLSHDREKQERILSRRSRWTFDFELENDNSLIGPLVELLQHQLKAWGEADRLRIGIALDEAIVNGMYHGNLEVGSELRQEDERAYYQLIDERSQAAPYCDRRLRVFAEFGPDWLRVAVEDEGPGFNPGDLPDPTDPANLDRVSGRGLLLIQTFMDEVHFNAKGNRIELLKRRSASDDEASSTDDSQSDESAEG